jgi:hypothetical protein
LTHTQEGVHLTHRGAGTPTIADAATARGSARRAGAGAELAALYDNQDDIDPLSAALQTELTVRMTSDRLTLYRDVIVDQSPPEVPMLRPAEKPGRLNPILQRSLMLDDQVDSGDVREVSVERLSSRVGAAHD